MERRPLGATGLSVSALGFGCGSIGGLMVRGEAAAQVRAVGRALQGGVTYFDTAPQYGEGRSETNLGRALRELRAAGSITLGTKVRLLPEQVGDPRPAVRASLEGSLRRLGRDHADVVHLHNPLVGPGGAGGLEGGETLAAVADAMRDLVRLGLARHVGVTGLGDSGALLAAVRGGGFATLQAYVNALNPSASTGGVAGGAQDFAGLIGEAAARGMGVLAVRVLAAGALAASPARHPLAGAASRPLAAGGEYARDVGRAAALGPLAAELGLEGTLELGLRFALTLSGVSTVLVGLSDLGQLEDALRWADRGALPAEAARRVVAAAAA